MTEIGQTTGTNPIGIESDPAGGGSRKAPVETRSDSTAAHGLEVEARSQWYYVRSRFLRHKLAVVSLVVLIVIFGCGFLAQWIATDDPATIHLNALLQPPSAEHYFGTDGLGRDYFSNVVWGIRTSAEVGVVVAILSSILGLIVGAIAGYYRGWADNVLMRITDLVLTLPALAILLVISKFLASGGSQWSITIILALFFWTGLARVVRGVFLSLREKEYVEAAKASGAGDLRIMFRHILPNTLGPVIVNGTLAVAAAILTEAALSFLGFGIKPPTPSLGVLVNDGETYPQDWWLTVIPGLVIIFIVLSVNFVGDGLRDAFDPQQRRVRA